MDKKILAGLCLLMLIPIWLGDEFKVHFPDVPVDILAGFAVGGLVFYLFQSDE